MTITGTARPVVMMTITAMARAGAIQTGAPARSPVVAGPAWPRVPVGRVAGAVVRRMAGVVAVPVVAGVRGVVPEAVAMAAEAPVGVADRVVRAADPALRHGWKREPVYGSLFYGEQ
ncbi:hypothetical protein A0U91_09195 [Acetobacter persici]|uniref:Uncharacterized protein n=1 Tax=Acetobacter persici TaxID=1076596 RepID=A0A1U9LF08_9PROT|nr:hypothetical protein A0U91_09195 [Acetobacter persici]